MGRRNNDHESSSQRSRRHDKRRDDESDNNRDLHRDYRDDASSVRRRNGKEKSSSSRARSRSRHYGDDKSERDERRARGKSKSRGTISRARSRSRHFNDDDTERERQRVRDKSRGKSKPRRRDEEEDSKKAKTKSKSRYDDDNRRKQERRGISSRSSSRYDDGADEPRKKSSSASKFETSSVTSGRSKASRRSRDGNSHREDRRPRSELKRITETNARRADDARSVTSSRSKQSKRAAMRVRTHEEDTDNGRSGGIRKSALDMNVLSQIQTTGGKVKKAVKTNKPKSSKLFSFGLFSSKKDKGSRRNNESNSPRNPGTRDDEDSIRNRDRLSPPQSIRSSPTYDMSPISAHDISPPRTIEANSENRGYKPKMDQNYKSPRPRGGMSKTPRYGTSSNNMENDEISVLSNTSYGGKSISSSMSYKQRPKASLRTTSSYSTNGDHRNSEREYERRRDANIRSYGGNGDSNASVSSRVHKISAGFETSSGDSQKASRLEGRNQVSKKYSSGSFVPVQSKASDSSWRKKENGSTAHRYSSENKQSHPHQLQNGRDISKEDVSNTAYQPSKKSPNDTMQHEYTNFQQHPMDSVGTRVENDYGRSQPNQRPDHSVQNDRTNEQINQNKQWRGANNPQQSSIPPFRTESYNQFYGSRSENEGQPDNSGQIQQRREVSAPHNNQWDAFPNNASSSKQHPYSHASTGGNMNNPSENGGRNHYQSNNNNVVNQSKDFRTAQNYQIPHENHRAGTSPAQKPWATSGYNNQSESRSVQQNIGTGAHAIGGGTESIQGFNANNSAIRHGQTERRGDLTTRGSLPPYDIDKREQGKQYSDTPQGNDIREQERQQQFNDRSPPMNYEGNRVRARASWHDSSLPPTHHEHEGIVKATNDTWREIPPQLSNHHDLSYSSAPSGNNYDVSRNLSSPPENGYNGGTESQRDQYNNWNDNSNASSNIDQRRNLAIENSRSPPNSHHNDAEGRPQSRGIYNNRSIPNQSHQVEGLGRIQQQTRETFRDDVRQVQNFRENSLEQHNEPRDTWKSEAAVNQQQYRNENMQSRNQLQAPNRDTPPHYPDETMNSNNQRSIDWRQSSNDSMNTSGRGGNNHMLGSSNSNDPSSLYGGANNRYEREGVWNEDPRQNSMYGDEGTANRSQTQTSSRENSRIPSHPQGGSTPNPNNPKREGNLTHPDSPMTYSNQNSRREIPHPASQYHNHNIEREQTLRTKPQLQPISHPGSRKNGNDHQVPNLNASKPPISQPPISQPPRPQPARPPAMPASALSLSILSDLKGSNKTLLKKAEPSAESTKPVAGNPLLAQIKMGGNLKKAPSVDPRMQVVKKGPISMAGNPLLAEIKMGGNLKKAPPVDPRMQVVKKGPISIMDEIKLGKPLNKVERKVVPKPQSEEVPVAGSLGDILANRRKMMRRRSSNDSNGWS